MPQAAGRVGGGHVDRARPRQQAGPRRRRPRRAAAADGRRRPRSGRREGRRGL